MLWAYDHYKLYTLLVRGTMIVVIKHIYYSHQSVRWSLGQRLRGHRANKALHYARNGFV